jgi:hypothetical protein
MTYPRPTAMPWTMPGKATALPAFRAPGASAPGADADQWNESPQAHDPVAFGLSMVKPCFSIVSTKSIVAPVR